MTSFIVDTNVAVVANGRGDQDPACVTACTKTLQKIVNDGVLYLDTDGLILDEYHGRLNFHGNPGVGDAFYKHVFSNQANVKKCVAVHIHIMSNGSFKEFPSDPEMRKFDRSDKKFVAVARKARNIPRIQNAVDSDWWNFRLPLKKHGLKIDFVCGCERWEKAKPLKTKGKRKGKRR